MTIGIKFVVLYVIMFMVIFIVVLSVVVFCFFILSVVLLNAVMLRVNFIVVLSVIVFCFFIFLDLSVLKIKTKIVSGHTADSKPVKQEVNSTVILPP